MKRGKTITSRSVLTILTSAFSLALLLPLSANAQVTVKHILVSISSPHFSTTPATYCDTNGTACNTKVWNLTAAGVTLTGGQTLVLTQTGLIAGVGGNFDTSDRVRTTAPTELECNGANNGDFCTVTIALDTGSGLTQVYSNVSSPLDLNNTDRGVGQLEYLPYQLAFTAPNYTLQLGYADDAHQGCPAGGCLPTPFNGDHGTAAATHFMGAPVDLSQFPGGTCTSCFDAGAVLITGVTVPVAAEGRMTGGGSVFTSAGIRVTHGLELHCSTLSLPNNLEINWDKGNNFHLDTLTKVTCLDDPKIKPQPPNAGFDTMIGEGTGTLNGKPATIKFTLTDAGEPGKDDTAQYEIKQNSVVVLSVSPQNLDKGNQQAHKN